jgi:secreted trypsin-like serine protease
MKKKLAACLLFLLVLWPPVSWGQILSFDQPDTRIIGGVFRDESYPWMVSIQRGSHFCGGVLIAKDWVLTAAHCLDDKTPDELTLYIGLDSLSYPSSGDVRKADWFVLHPDYNDRLFYSDVAIIKLNQSATKTPIDILSRNDTKALQQNEQLRVLGWGVTDSGLSSRILKQVDVSFQRDAVCNSTYPINSIKGYWDRSFCAGEVSGGKDSCQGDSGGPILVKANGEWVLTGLVSWGSGCAQPGLYGVYSEVSAMGDWIEQSLNDVSLLGTEKMGFVGKGRDKPQTFTLFNMSANSQSVTDKSTNNMYFSIDDGNWLLDAPIPSGYACDFTVNAQGYYSGEHYGKLDLDLTDKRISHELNAKVLNTIDASALDTQWQFYSGTSQNTEHSAPWYQQTDGSQGAVMRSGDAPLGGRSVLLTYLNGPVGSETLYLKFESSVVNNGNYNNYLGLSINSKDVVNVGKQYWSTREFELDKGLNYVAFIYYQANTSKGYAKLNNLRICSDQDNESTCSSASGFYNADDLAAVDDPLPSETWQSVCRDLNYSNNTIVFASRNSSDVIFRSEADRLAGSKVSGGLIESRTGGGSVNLWFVIGLFLLARHFRIIKRSE